MSVLAASPGTGLFAGFVNRGKGKEQTIFSFISRLAGEGLAGAN
jgi:hypothetical protein